MRVSLVCFVKGGSTCRAAFCCIVVDGLSSIFRQVSLREVVLALRSFSNPSRILWVFQAVCPLGVIFCVTRCFLFTFDLGS